MVVIRKGAGLTPYAAPASGFKPAFSSFLRRSSPVTMVVNGHSSSSSPFFPGPSFFFEMGCAPRGASHQRAFSPGLPRGGQSGGRLARRQAVPPAPLCAVFEFGYEEVARQVKDARHHRHKTSLERPSSSAAQRGTFPSSNRHELAGHHRHGEPIYRPVRHRARHHSLLPGLAGGSASLRAVAPGISEALVATRPGLVRRHPRGHLLQPLRPTRSGRLARDAGFFPRFMNLRNAASRTEPMAFSSTAVAPRPPSLPGDVFPFRNQHRPAGGRGSWCCLIFIADGPRHGVRPGVDVPRCGRCRTAPRSFRSSR